MGKKKYTSLKEVTCPEEWPVSTPNKIPEIKTNPNKCFNPVKAEKKEKDQTLRRGLFFMGRQCSSLICKRAENSELIWGQKSKTWTFVRFIFIKHQIVCCLKSFPGG